MLRVALTGGIASGKSAAAKVFRGLGVPVIDTDRIARDLAEPGQPGLEALIRELGSGILDARGNLDRTRLRQRIFSDESLRQRVNATLHPLVLETVERELAHLDAPYAVIEIPLLAETGMSADFDRVLVIDASDKVRIERLETRDKVSANDARAALKAQAPREERLRLASDVIENNGSLADLDAAVRTLHARYLEAAKRFASPADPPAE